MRSGMWHYQALSRLSCFGGFVLMKLKWWRAQQLRFGVNSSLLRSLFSNSPYCLPYIILVMMVQNLVLDQLIMH